MTILPQVQAELVAAAGRPVLKKRVSVRAVAAVIAAVLALLITAQPTVARPPVYPGVVTARV
jgi:hypothetical protein